MGYQHIINLYKEQTILMFKEVFAMEKIHGTSAHITWKAKEKEVLFFSGSASHTHFVSKFNIEDLKRRFSNIFVTSNVTVYGEAYGGKQAGMSGTYGKDLKFIGFDVQVGDYWLSVPNAEDVCIKLGLEFVDYVKVSTDLASLDAERDKDSVQAVRNGCGEGKMREGVVLRPLIELTTNNGERLMAKHRRDEFSETKTPREVSSEQFKVLEDAKEIAEEWCTEKRLWHVLDKLPQATDLKSMKLVIDAMVEDVYREAEGEIIESKEVTKAIGSKTATMFKAEIEAKKEFESKVEN